MLNGLLVFFFCGCQVVFAQIGSTTSTGATDSTEVDWDEVGAPAATTASDVTTETVSYSAASSTASTGGTSADGDTSSDDSSDALGQNQVLLGQNQSAIASGINTLNANQAILATNQTTLQNGQKAISTKQSTGFNTTTSNQNVLKTNQSRLYDQADANTTEIMGEIQNMLDADKLRGVLYGYGADQDNGYADNFLAALNKELMGIGRQPQASADISAAANVMMFLAQSAEYKQAANAGMAESIGLLYSGAGNKYGADTLSITNVLPSVEDPYLITATAYEQMIYPIMQETTIGVYEAASCSSRPRLGIDSRVCDLQISAEYTKVLNTSGEKDFKTSCDNPNSGAGTNSVPSGGSLQLAEGSYPVGACGAMANPEFLNSENETWNGVLTLLRAHAELRDRCNDFINNASFTDTASTNLKANVAVKCNEFISRFDDDGIQDYIDNTSDKRSTFQTSLKSYLGAQSVPIKDIVNRNRKLLFLKIFSAKQSNQSGSSLSAQEQSILNSYGSPALLVGPSSYDVGSSAPAFDSDKCIDVMKGYVQNPGSYTVTTNYITDSSNSDAAKSALAAQLYIDQLLNNLPSVTTLAVPSLPQDCDGALVVKNGKPFCFQSSDGSAKLPSDASTEIAIEKPADAVSNQTSASNNIQAFANTYRDSHANLNMKKVFLLSVVLNSFNERNIQLTVTENATSSNSCTFTPKQAMDFAINWRSNPSQTFNNADDVAFDAANGTGAEQSTTDILETATGNFVEHLATSDLTETVKELTSLMQLQTVLSNKLNSLVQTQNFLMLISASDGIQTSQANLQTRTLGLEQMRQDYYSASASTASGSAVE